MALAALPLLIALCQCSTGSRAGAVAGPGAAPQTMPGGAPVARDHAPAAQSFPAGDQHWRRLPDDDDHSRFALERGKRFAVVPLQAQNFPPGFDFCTAPRGDAELNDKQQWARAELVAALTPWAYDVTIIAVPEEDGETPYRLVINGKTVRTFTTPPTGTLGARDRVPLRHTWKDVVIRAGDNVQVWSRPHSNLAITEGAQCRKGAGFERTYAWARARWDGLELVPTAGRPPAP